jgi:hypothetical protein
MRPPGRLRGEFTTAPHAVPQADFAAALLDAGRAPPAGLRVWNGSDPARRFGVHRNNVVVALTQALADTFPVIRQLVGEAFFDAMAGAYLRAQPPRSSVLAHWGEGFADWLSGFAPARGLPYLADMARLERARVAAWQAADAPALTADELHPRLADAAALPGARVLLHPSCRVLRSPYDVHALWAAHQQPGDWPALDIDRPCALLVLRDAADDVLVLGLAWPDAELLEALRQGATLSEAVARAPTADFSATLALLLRHGALVGWTVPGDPT